MSVADEPLSIAERKALVLKRIFENMPVYIGPGELIVGTRTFLRPTREMRTDTMLFNTACTRAFLI